MTRFLGCVRPGDLFIELNHSWRNSALYGIDTNLLGKLSFVEIVINPFVVNCIFFSFFPRCDYSSKIWHSLFSLVSSLFPMDVILQSLFLRFRISISGIICSKAD